MKQSLFTGAQILEIRRAAQAGEKVADLLQRHGISETPSTAGRASTRGRIGARSNGCTSWRWRTGASSRPSPISPWITRRSARVL